MEEKCILDPQRDCIGKAEAAKLEGRIKALEEWREDSKDFHAKSYDWQRQQIARDARLYEKLSGMDENIKKVLATQEAYSLKPGKRWDAIVDKAIWAVLRRLSPLFWRKSVFEREVKLWTSELRAWRPSL